MPKTTAVCLQHGCPTIVDAHTCWCFEHLRHCANDDCPHAAHYCEEAVHYCDEHQPDSEGSTA